MSLLRSKCHQAKDNFRKMNKNNLKCSLGCNSIETQNHIFEECPVIINHIKLNNIIQIDKVYGSLEEQKSVIKILIQIEDTRKLLIEEEKNSASKY